MKKKKYVKYWTQNFKSYDAICNTLSRWKFPAWPNDVVGCANLLLEQSKALHPYIMPLYKATHTLGPIIGQDILKRIDDNGFAVKMIGEIQNWISSCPFIKDNEECRIKFLTEGQDIKQSIDLNKYYFNRTYGLFNFLEYKPTRRRIPRRSSSRQVTTIWNIISFFSTEAKVTNIGKVALIKFKNSSKKESPRFKTIEESLQYYKVDNEWGLQPLPEIERPPR